MLATELQGFLCSQEQVNGRFQKLRMALPYLGLGYSCLVSTGLKDRDSFAMLDRLRAAFLAIRLPLWTRRS
jgi:hypothetical protein